VNPEESIAERVEAIAAELEVVISRPAHVEADCARLRALLPSPPTAETLERLLPLLPHLARRADGSVAPVFELLEEVAAACADPWPLLRGLLAARDAALAQRALDLAARLVASGSLPEVRPLVQFLAARAEIEGSPLHGHPALEAIARILHAGPRGAAESGDPALALYLEGGSGSLRRLAARVLDLPGQPAPPERAARVLGPEAHAVLDKYLQYTRATHLDLLHLAPGPGAPPPVLDSLRAAEDECGEAVLRDVIAELGWPRVNLGVQAWPRTGVSVGGSLPFWVGPAEARLLESCGDTRRVGDCFLIVAQGGLPREGPPADGGEDPVPRFRAYNLSHAELLGDLLDVAPLSREKVERILERTDRIVEGFVSLFGAFTPECAILPAVYAELKQTIRAELTKQPAHPQLSAELTRRVQAFEDPTSLADVRTLHGLKRYLHQQGLRLGFRLVEAGRATNRTVDMLVASRTRVLRAPTQIAYVDFEPQEESAIFGDEARGIPYPVASLVEAFGLQLLHGHDAFPEVKIFCYGNEVHYYMAFGNHPAFLRVDFAPPLKGGMIDLEYYGVSKYVLREHPNPDLDALRAFFRRLDFDVRVQNTHVQARYDKERAVDMAELCERAEAVFRLAPHLMDLDWVIGDLRLGADARSAVIDAWAARFERWGVVPVAQILTRDRCGVRTDGGPGGLVDGDRAWEGSGAYQDRFRAVPPSFLGRLAAALTDLGLDPPAPAGEGPADLGQVDLERSVLRPVREALARGELTVQPEGLCREPPERFQREHEAEAFAAILGGPDGELASAAGLALLVGPLERSLRFRSTGSVNGYDVQRARLALRGEALQLCVLRDSSGIARLALFARGDTLWRRRGGPGELWERNRSCDSTLLASLLRRNSYLPPGAGSAPPLSRREAAELRGLFRQPNALVPLRPVPGERVVPGLRVAPGRAAGRAVFGTAGRRPAEFHGAVLVAPSVRPEDAPFLDRAAGIVSTGGGTLSHAALIAAQLRKPALVVPGRWREDPDGITSLVCRALEYTEEERTEGRWRITLRRSPRERECPLREGDLLVLDGDRQSLGVLGQDHQALALHEGLEQFGEASRHLSGAGEGRELLELRGRRLRAAHQIRKLLGQLTSPALARHATHEILVGGAFSGETADAKGDFLAVLLENRSVAEGARTDLIHLAAALARRHQTSREEARRRIPVSGSLYAVLAMRIEALRLGRTLAGVTHALRSCGLAQAAPAEPEPADLDRPARIRLERLRAERIGAACAAAGDGAGRARLRHLLRQLERLDQALGAPGPEGGAVRRLRAGLDAEDATARRRAEDRRVVERGECGFEIPEQIGWKAANLGEVERLAGPGRVPPWFVVTHRAFEEVLAAPVDPADAAGDGRARRATPLRLAIDAVLARSDLDEDQKSARIRTLWERVTLPRDIGRDVLAAYGRLKWEALSGSRPDVDAGAPFVAVRSSACEEDTEAAARAGEFDTFLFVRGEEEVLLHLKRAWSGLWSARAVRSRAKLGLGAARVGGGVIIQRIVDARVSGVLQTVNLAEGELGEIVVNAGLGLGEGIVSGVVAADHAVVAKEGDLEHGPLRFRYVTADKRERVVFDRSAGSGTVRTECLYHQRLRPALEYTELCELTSLAVRLETAYGYPLDIEFALEGARLWILQARPVAAFRAVLRETVERYPLSATPVRPARAALEEIPS
jgi:phosphohistidine swiveling domain-containing protein